MINTREKGSAYWITQIAAVLWQVWYYACRVSVSSQFACPAPNPVFSRLILKNSITYRWVDNLFSYFCRRVICWLFILPAFLFYNFHFPNSDLFSYADTSISEFFELWNWKDIWWWAETLGLFKHQWNQSTSYGNRVDGSGLRCIFFYSCSLQHDLKLAEHCRCFHSPLELLSDLFLIPTEYNSNGLQLWPACSVGVCWGARIPTDVQRQLSKTVLGFRA
jgi:hypothetical protein